MVTSVRNILDAAQSSRLNALKTTSRDMDVVSARLASGRKVQSAIDNPQNYFASLNLKNRANDLAKLLDGIGQNLRTLQVAENGIESALDIIDTAESYLENIEQKFLNGTIDLTDELPTQSFSDTAITFAGSSDFQPYGGSQNVPSSGPLIVTGNNEVSIGGNYWRRKLVNYTITENTVLRFEFRSTLEPEAAAIGFDNDTNFNNDNYRFYLYGTQVGGVNYAAPEADYAYTDPGNWQEIEIPVGEFFTGSFSHMTFINDDDAAPVGNSSYRNVVLREVTNHPAESPLSKGYVKILNQLDALVADAHYRGVNLLQGDDMSSYFNPDRSSTLVSEGMDATYAGLGLDVTDFSTLESVRAKMEQIRDARETLRNYATTLATDLTIIETRQDLTNGQIINARAGADDLTVADLNEEGARMLALETLKQIQVSVIGMRTANILSVLS